MVDDILQFADEAAAQQALPQLYSTDGGWDMSVCIPNVSVYQITGTTPDAGGNPIDVRSYASGWFIRVAVDTGITPFDETGWTSEPVFAS